jgi:hypothetical protein
MGYREVERNAGYVLYDKRQPGVAPSPAVFELTWDPLTREDVADILSGAGVDQDVFFATLEEF